MWGYMNIIQEKDIELYNKKYKEITYEDGSAILRYFNEKYKMWATLKFKPSEYDDSKSIESLKLATRNALIGTILSWIVFSIMIQFTM